MTYRNFYSKGLINTILTLSLAVIHVNVAAQTKAKSTNNQKVKLSERWSEQKANEWYQNQAWLVGANYVPASASNQLEMWQADTFDPKLIELEFQWAEELGFNTMRVFLHNLVWREDSTAFLKRIEYYLEIAEKHHIKTMFVLLDDVWNPEPKIGIQPTPTPGVHNAGWVQSPGRDILTDNSQWHHIESYVKGILTHFTDDHRVLIWDLYNEPGNPNSDSYGAIEAQNKEKHSLKLLEEVYRWAREVNPSQPICIDVWTSIHKNIDEMSDIDEFAFHHSDVINFHCYANAEITKNMVKRLSVSNRPLFCTEYMARSIGSTFQDILPVFKKYKVAAYNWGFVSGKSQTIYPWGSWKNAYTKEPELWFHDIYRDDGKPYQQEEIDFIKQQILE